MTNFDIKGVQGPKGPDGYSANDPNFFVGKVRSDKDNVTSTASSESIKSNNENTIQIKSDKSLDDDELKLGQSKLNKAKINISFLSGMMLSSENLNAGPPVSDDSTAAANMQQPKKLPPRK